MVRFRFPIAISLGHDVESRGVKLRWPFLTVDCVTTFS
jgi:hypothetical protein